MQEISNMGNIYKHCVFTFSADNCCDSRENLLGNHVTVEQEYVQQGCHSSREGFSNVIHAFNDDKRQKGHSDTGFLGSRAWTFQEQVLSPRTLQWTSLQLVWSCRSTIRTEEDPTGGDPQTLSGALYYPTKLICLSREQLKVAMQDQLKHHPDGGECDPLKIWYQMVSQFCARNITFEEDSLPAISGLAREVERHTGYAYRAGIWAQDYHNGLLWLASGRASYPSTYIAPSWSWAAIKSGIVVQMACLRRPRPKLTSEKVVFTPIAELLEVDIMLFGEDEFGPITAGKLQINASYKTQARWEKMR
jgi:hypothetical protein